MSINLISGLLGGTQNTNEANANTNTGFGSLLALKENLFTGLLGGLPVIGDILGQASSGVTTESNTTKQAEAAVNVSSQTQNRFQSQLVNTSNQPITLNQNHANHQMAAEHNHNQASANQQVNTETTIQNQQTTPQTDNGLFGGLLGGGNGGIFGSFATAMGAVDFGREFEQKGPIGLVHGFFDHSQHGHAGVNLIRTVFDPIAMLGGFSRAGHVNPSMWSNLFPKEFAQRNLPEHEIDVLHHQNQQANQMQAGQAAGNHDHANH